MAENTSGVLIDPELLMQSTPEATSCHLNNSQRVSLPSSRPPSASDASPLGDSQERLIPQKDSEGNMTETREQVETRLQNVKTKAPLSSLCTTLHIKVPKSAKLDRLRSALLDFWYPKLPNPIPPAQSSSSLLDDAHSTHPSSPPDSSVPPVSDRSNVTRVLSEGDGATGVHSALPLRRRRGVGDQDDEEALVDDFDVDQAGRDILGYDRDEDEDEDEDLDLDDDANFQSFQTKLRVDATKRAEGNRRAGGLKTQEALEFEAQALADRKIRDTIVDEHYLLLLINHTADRPKRTRRGIDIPGTYVGASQQKKIFFAALRIRKQQEANDATLRTRRPSTSVTVWDLLKTRMDMALTRARCGLIPGEDAPDIIKNTFLSSITEEQIREIGLKGFLMHRELRSVIFGHLAWNSQHATGNRGDDFRALKLAELQPHVLLHPNKETAIPCILGLQGEEKAGKRGLKTIINPSYTTFIAHLNPEQCPMGAFAFYFHYLFDVKKINDELDIDWSLNKSWRQARVLHGPSSPTAPFSEQSMYNLYVRAFQKVDFDSPVKVHLPRHMLGYRQEGLGVQSEQTSKLGWSRNSTYHDVYAPAIPVTAVLGGAGYKAHEDYNPCWRHVHVPEQFLLLICPMAEEIHDSIIGQKNLSGAANFWSLIIQLRPYIFQCGAAIYQHCPGSPLFKLPALADPDVRNWMADTFPTLLSRVRASAGSPVDLQRIQTETLRLALEELRVITSAMHLQIRLLRDQLERRTQVLSPTQGYSMQQYQRHITSAASSVSMKALATVVEPASVASSTSCTLLPAAEISPGPLAMATPTSTSTAENATGVYVAEDSTLRAHVSPSSKSSSTPRSRTSVDLVMPPLAAFSAPDGPMMIFPPLLGQKSVKWEDIFKLIKQPGLLWEIYQPSKTLDQWANIDEQYSCWMSGEVAISEVGIQTGIKPPLRLLEQFFRGDWRKKGGKKWQRFREIPEFIDRECATRSVSPLVIIEELGARLSVEKTVMINGVEQRVTEKIGLNALTNKLAQERKDAIAIPEESSGAGQKKRATAVGARRPPAKKQKTN